MTKFDRSKFKSTSVAVAQQVDQEVEQAVGKGSGPNADYFKIKEGTQYYRIYPPHPADGGELYAQPKCVVWLPQEVAKRDKQGNILKDGKDKVITEIANRPIFNAKIHGGKKKDLAEEYTAFAQKIANENFSTEAERKKFLDPVIGGFESKFDGIQFRQTWVIYADQLIISKDKVTKVLGRLDIGKAVKNRLNSLAATESTNDPLGTDPFTNPDDGRAISIAYDKTLKAQDMYKTEFYAPLVSGSNGKIQLFPLSDEDLEKFENYPSLKKMFVGVYDRKTFDTTLKGLKMFDDEHELGIFGYEAWLDICEELAKDFPESGSDGEGGEGNSTGDEFDDMDRDELKAFIRSSKLGITVTKSMDDDKVRELVREAVAALETEEQEEEEEEEDDDTSKADVMKTSASKTAKDKDRKDMPWEKGEGKKEEGSGEEKPKLSAKEKLAAIKAKTNK